ncbi:DnaD domain protein [Lentibacillus cibarius]|uniref:DnaD domain protein n=1 Tax=Lentibacillus cibarius TaxID=2583219 RepID=A0A549YA59_9BACI|nr:DnaD domain protein [Lentibacillus cibarius]TRM08771.1 DnaD domain protein [Lentibacillus cibarius]TRM08799.1 DnaD domain protein [Lentibacillus cibarius]TRM12873.1 DnaD domain protein [Lentibacillus cibarius]
MNYIKEMNAFYDWLEINELSPSAINLWYALMHINNKAGWAETFTVAQSVLCVKTGLTERTIRNVRNELKQKGRIDFSSRKGGKTPVYKIISFESTENNSAASSVSISGGSSGGSAEGRSTLIKQNETKQNVNKDLGYARVIQFAQKSFMVLSDKQTHKLDSYYDSLGETLVIEAMRRAQIDGKKFDYASGIMREWFNKGVKNMDDVARDDNNFKRYRDKQKSDSGSRYGSSWG